MAKNKKSKKRPASDHHGNSASAVSVATDGPDDERFERANSGDDSGLTPGSGDNGGGSADVTTSSGDRGGGGRRSAREPGFFDLYKPGQGYYTRLGTAIGGGAVIVFGAHYLYGQLSGDNPMVQLGVPSILLAVLGVVLFWIAGSNRKTNDFFIATEGEMKKVSWSTKKEVIGSTKVVLAFTFMMALFLFVADAVFILIFSYIDVLQLPIKKLLGLE
jgi:preprotein translocase subunit SecE